MNEDNQIKNIPDYPVRKIAEKSNLLIRGLQELGLLNKILKLISGGETIRIRALDGSRVFKFSDGDLFKYVFFDLAGFDTNEHPTETGEAELLVYELVKDANIYQMFNSLNKSFEQLCLTQNQILEFLDKYKRYSKNKTNHFLVKSNGKIFVAQICADSDDSMRLFGGHISDNDINGSVYPASGVSFRVVVPI